MKILKTVAEIRGVYDEDLRDILRIVEDRGFLVLAESGYVYNGRCETLKILKASETNRRKPV